MKRILELHVECHDGSGEHLAELGIDVDDKEFRSCLVPFDAISIIYPSIGRGTFIMLHGDYLLFKESFEEIKAMIYDLHPPNK